MISLQEERDNLLRYYMTYTPGGERDVSLDAELPDTLTVPSTEKMISMKPGILVMEGLKKDPTYKSHIHLLKACHDDFITHQLVNKYMRTAYTMFMGIDPEGVVKKRGSTVTAAVQQREFDAMFYFKCLQGIQDHILIHEMAFPHRSKGWVKNLFLCCNLDDLDFEEYNAYFKYIGEFWSVVSQFEIEVGLMEERSNEFDDEKKFKVLGL